MKAIDKLNESDINSFNRNEDNIIEYVNKVIDLDNFKFKLSS